MKIRTIATAAAGFCLVAGLARATPPEMPKPGPEVQKLGYFDGHWTGESEMKPGPFGPGGKMTSSDHCAWFHGGFQMVCSGEGKGPMGEFHSVGVLGYNTEEKHYVYFGYDSTGMMTTAQGKLDGKTWVWNGQDKMGGKLIHSRYTITEVSPTSYTFKWETSEDGKSWARLAEGKSTKR
jgi:hypothetical protein